MRYAIIVYESPAGMEARKNPEYQAAYAAYLKALSDAGIRLAGVGLHSVTRELHRRRLALGIAAGARAAS